MDELDRLRRAHTAIPAADRGVTERARSRLDAVIAASQPAPRRRRRVLRFTAPALALAIIAVIAVAVTPDGSRLPARPDDAHAARACLRSPSGPATACLTALGDVAGARQVLAEGDVFYRRDLTAFGVARFGPNARPTPYTVPGGFDVTLPGRQELWLTADRSGRYVWARDGTPFLASPADRRAWQAAGAPALADILPRLDPRGDGEVRDFDAGGADELLLGNGSLNQVLPDDPFALPLDPPVLERRLLRLAWEQRTRISGEGPCRADLSDCSPQTVRNIRSQFGTNATTLLNHPLAPPQLRRALFRVLSDVEGTRLLGPLRDPVGRLGAAILLPEGMNDGKNVLLFDAQTARLLADGRAADGDLDALRWGDVYAVSSGAVDEVGQRP